MTTPDPADPLLREAELLREEVALIAAALQRAPDLNADAMARLTEQVHRLSDIAEGVAHRTTAVERINRRLTATVWVLGCAVAAIVVLGSLAGLNAARIADLQHRTSSDVLCPVFQTYLDAYRPDAVPPERRPEYEQAYKVMRHSYQVLDCTPPSA